jgi:hypothetical protein
MHGAEFAKHHRKMNTRWHNRLINLKHHAYWKEDLYDYIRYSVNHKLI